MDCYDEILEFACGSDKTNNFIKSLTHIINKKSDLLTTLQFKNCLILTLAIWNPRFIDTYFIKGKRADKLDKNKKRILIELLKSEFRD
jgi:hypothetical protein